LLWLPFDSTKTNCGKITNGKLNIFLIFFHIQFTEIHMYILIYIH
jgi:hypothetical protein